MARTIYSRYSNERAERYCIRTDIVQEDEGTKAVYKKALYIVGQNHIEHMKQSYKQLKAAYQNTRIVFCECQEEDERIRFPFVEGETLQEIMEQAVMRQDKDTISRIIQEYIYRFREAGGKEAFVLTGSFVEVFGTVVFDKDMECAKVSDIDMIFSNILIESKTDISEIEKACWRVIDYEWTFDFPIPKDFIIYRALHFAYYQILNNSSVSLIQLMEHAGITENMQHIFGRMEESFQEYIGKGAVPVRNMQRSIGTKIFSIEQLMSNTCGQTGESIVHESKWVKVRKLQFHIDRDEYQDGSIICCGWAFAKTKDGRYLPVDIRVADEQGLAVPVEIHRMLRNDVAEAYRTKHVTEPQWGFNCVWMSKLGKRQKIIFSLGRYEKIYEVGSKTIG